MIGKVSGLSPGWYVYEVDVNYARAFHERSFENNQMKMLVYINPDYVCDEKLNYCDLIVATGACNNLPANLPVPPECDDAHLLYCGGSTGNRISSCPEASLLQ